MAQRQWRSDDTDKWKYGFGKGVDGALNISSNTNFSAANASCAGTSGTKSLTLGAASTFANGDLVLIHQSRGTGAGSWELNKIVSGGGSTSITLESDLQNTYTDSSNSQAQILELKQYSSVTISSGFTWTGTSWNGDTGGILAYLCNGKTTVNGTITVQGRGFRGGNGVAPGDQTGLQGESSLGAGSRSTSANGNGGGGGSKGTGTEGSGGGGGHGSAGGNGQNGRTTNGSGGSTVGNAELTTLLFGGGGGQGGAYNGNPVGGNGGGILLAISAEFEINNSTGSINLNGNQGNAAGSGTGSGGSGAGGAGLIKTQVATLNTTKMIGTGPAGAVGEDSRTGGAGGTGRIHLDYSDSYTGTTTPTLDAILDPTIKVSAGMMQAMQMLMMQ